MDAFCYNHSEERAVGYCGTCRRPTCYRCSLNMDQKVFCSLDCFNNLNPPSGDFNPRRPPGPEETSSDALSALEEISPQDPPDPTPGGGFDEYSDVVLSIQSASPESAPPAPAAPKAPEPVVMLDEEASVILSARQANPDDLSDTHMLEMNPVRPPLPGDGSTLVLIPGTKRALISSSCFFHPDTSAIVLCARCRNPICSLCAQETPEGLTYTPSCGPPDPAGARERRRITSINLVLAVGILVVVAGAGWLLKASRDVAAQLAAAPVKTWDDFDLPAKPPVKSPEKAPERVPPVSRAPEPTSSAARPAPPASPAPTAKAEHSPAEPRPATAPAVAQAPAPRPVLPPPAPVRTILPVLGPAPAPAAPAAPVLLPVAPPPPRPAPEPTPFEVDLETAAEHLRGAEPILREVADQVYPLLKPGCSPRELAARLAQAEDALLEVCSLYSRNLANAPDPALLSRRLEAIREVLQSVDAGMERLRQGSPGSGRQPR